MVWLHKTQGNMEVIEIQSEASVHVHLILTPNGVTAAHIYIYSFYETQRSCYCLWTNIRTLRHTISMTEGVAENQAAAYGLS